MTEINLDYLRNVILKKDIDAISDIMRNHSNTFIGEPVLKANPLIPVCSIEEEEDETKMYPPIFLAFVVLYAFQVFNSEENIEDLGKLIYDLSSRHLCDFMTQDIGYESMNRDVVHYIIWFLQYCRDDRIDSVFSYYADYVSKQDNEEFKCYLVSETLYNNSRPAWSMIVYKTFHKSIKKIFETDLQRISIMNSIYFRIEHIEVISKLCKDLTFSSRDLVLDLINFEKFTEHLYQCINRLYVALEYSNIRDYIQRAFQVFHHFTEHELNAILIHPDNEYQNKDASDIKTFETFYLNFIHEENERKRIASEVLETSLPKDIIDYVVLKYLKLRD